MSRWACEKIPKRLFLYWGRNRPLSLMRYLTVKSFVSLNPDWEVHIYYSRDKGREETWSTKEQMGCRVPRNYPNYFSKLQTLERVELVEVSFYSLGIRKRVAEVHKSDLLRWYLFSTFAGVWSDFDIVYIKPMSELMPLLAAEADLFFCTYKKDRRLVYPIGFLGAGEGAGQSFYEEVFERGKKLLKYDPKSIRGYQTFGRFLLEQMLSEKLSSASDDPAVSLLPSEVVYPVRNAHRYYRQQPLSLPPETIGLHWYAGHKASSQMEYTVTERNIQDKAKTSVLLRRMLEIVGD